MLVVCSLFPFDTCKHTLFLFLFFSSSSCVCLCFVVSFHSQIHKTSEKRTTSGTHLFVYPFYGSEGFIHSAGMLKLLLVYFKYTFILLHTMLYLQHWLHCNTQMAMSENNNSIICRKNVHETIHVLRLCDVMLLFLFILYFLSIFICSPKAFQPNYSSLISEYSFRVVIRVINGMNWWRRPRA